MSFLLKNTAVFSSFTVEERASCLVVRVSSWLQCSTAVLEETTAHYITVQLYFLRRPLEVQAERFHAKGKGSSWECIQWIPSLPRVSSNHTSTHPSPLPPTPNPPRGAVPVRFRMCTSSMNLLLTLALFAPAAAFSTTPADQITDVCAGVCRRHDRHGTRWHEHLRDGRAGP